LKKIRLKADFLVSISTNCPSQNYITLTQSAVTAALNTGDTFASSKFISKSNKKQ
jgi:hypothetical protein